MNEFVKFENFEAESNMIECGMKPEMDINNEIYLIDVEIDFKNALEMCR